MDYEQKYKESLERAKDQLDGAKVFDYDNEQIAHDIRTTVYSIFPELKEFEDERIRKELITHCRNTRCVTKEGAERIAKWLAWLEKQGEKPQGKSAQEATKEEKIDNANKVEPKFKVGDWFVTSYGKVNQVIAVDLDGDGFTLDDYTYFSGSWKDNYHLWTIQDAKGGDVLVSKFKQPFIYNGNYDEHNVGAYCGIVYDGSRFIETYNVCQWTDNKKIKPATKEQREQLEKAMADAGFTFDFDKKELKKIQQTPAWSKEDDENIMMIENRFSDLLEYIREDSSLTKHRKNTLKEDVIGYFNWIKSLKERIGNFDDGYKVGFSAAKHNQWKPSDE